MTREPRTVARRESSLSTVTRTMEVGGFRKGHSQRVLSTLKLSREKVLDAGSKLGRAVYLFISTTRMKALYGLR